jgi:hypothetical protein
MRTGESTAEDFSTWEFWLKTITSTGKEAINEDLQFVIPGKR